MTRKHFEAIARDINMNVKGTQNGDRLDALFIVACDLAATFSTFNANFSRTQFLTACGF